MSIFINILIFLHLLGLVIGLGSGMAAARLGPLYGTASAEQRSLLFRLGKMLGRNGHIGIGLLWMTGILLVWLAYGGVTGLNAWFWAKMVLVVVLSASVGVGTAAFRKFANGDMGASARVAMANRLNAACGVLILFTAVFAFN